MINNKLLILRKIGLFERNTKYETFFIDPHHVMNICSSYGDPTKIFAMNGVHFRKCSYNAFKKGSMFPQHVSPSKIGENLNYQGQSALIFFSSWSHPHVILILLQFLISSRRFWELVLIKLGGIQRICNCHIQFVKSTTRTFKVFSVSFPSMFRQQTKSSILEPLKCLF